MGHSPFHMILMLDASQQNSIPFSVPYPCHPGGLLKPLHWESGHPQSYDTMMTLTVRFPPQEKWIQLILALSTLSL